MSVVDHFTEKSFSSLFIALCCEKRIHRVNCNGYFDHWVIYFNFAVPSPGTSLFQSSTFAGSVEKNSAEEFLNTKRALQQFQIDRLSSDYSDLRRSPEWGQLWNYFISEIYCPKDFTDRNTQFGRLTSLFKSSLGKKIFRDSNFLLDLQELTDELDNRLVEKLLEMGIENKIILLDYDRAYRLCDNYDKRLKQLDMIIKSIHNVHQISSHWYIGLLIKSAKIMAGLLTPNSLLISLEKGCNILRNIKDIYVFTEQLFNKEFGEAK